MQTAPDLERLERWLAAETADDELAAELVFGTLLAAAPRLEPAAGFADRVLARAGVGVGVVAPVASSSRRWLLRLAAAFAALVVGPAMALVLPLLLPLLRTLDVGSGVALAARVFAGLGSWLGHGVRFWDLLAALAQPVRAAAFTQGGLAVLLVCTALCVLASRLLYEIDSAHRSSVHASA